LGAYGSLSRGYDPGYLLRESSKGAEGYYLSAVEEIVEPPGLVGRVVAARCDAILSQELSAADYRRYADADARATLHRQVRPLNRRSRECRSVLPSRHSMN
jgi:hypothetical protein